ncbi:hypothetical protein CANTEDRAFT_112895 [Yamadazyma tenuis ATCC 10573]|uniref:Uncharacterized protein n=1 Tax=Candida tenuis (strain ATCC 10573 / BCRC 21748 / CBS 615 / JCM 9827 / NBRC 10315 / NRRL Y-1498 / VKM Y-70) TaxID=590646 RepID=G3AZ83_CANTC|nr:uncharacterized protein CANTEDRAFT_112895 [Yamadazyma tenuis ATCC 10573]EGV66289.1 hypothetical protein CANTEDRAFT_112895 [Yamadazyma tenuis ATCC 10573]
MGLGVSARSLLPKKWIAGIRWFCGGNLEHKQTIVVPWGGVGATDGRRNQAKPEIKVTDHSRNPSKNK